MYSLIFTSILVIILLWKAYKPLKKKRSSDFKDIDDELVIMLNEGDSIG
ncbi:hypothetical protein J1P26_18310 [Neobacillus sp. MM2021_6]|nr:MULTISPECIES: hypothetical protein [Bacillaceae]MBO0961661.1 hypothetical protein [Neobacillus sp. MM2021_6]NHC20573.1 hypothetical protein [Bacillus sp. MM2020_4]